MDFLSLGINFVTRVTRCYGKGHSHGIFRHRGHTLSYFDNTAFSTSISKRFPSEKSHARTSAISSFIAGSSLFLRALPSSPNSSVIHMKVFSTLLWESL